VKFVSCGACSQGFIYSVNEYGEGIAKECDCHKKWYAETILNYKIEQANLPLFIKDYSIEQYAGSRSSIDMLNRIKLYVEKFKEKYHSYHLYLWSKENSTQKTTVASWIGKELLAKGFSVKFVLMNDLIKLIMQAMYDDTFIEQIESYASCDYLIIDEAFDARKVTVYRSGYQIPFLDSFLRKRMTIQSKATCFTSNISIDEIGKTFDTSIENLMRRSILDPMYFSDDIQGSILSEESIKSMWE